MCRAEAGALLGEEEEEVEPSWELPEELRDAQCPSDRKELLQFRQSQQAARKVNLLCHIPFSVSFCCH